MRVPRFDRYILRDLWLPSLAGTIVFVGVVLANVIVKSSEVIFGLHTPASVVLSWLCYRLPYIVVFALPVGCMLGANLTVIRLGRDNELVPLRMGGLSLRRFFRPFFAFGLAGSLLALLVNEYLVPPTLARANEIQARAILMAPDQVVQANKTFSAEGQTYCHVQRVDMRSAELTSVLIYRFENRRPREAMAAARARKVDGVWRLEHGQRVTFDDKGRWQSAESFESAPVGLAPDLVELWDDEKTAEQFNLREGLDRLRLQRAAGDSAAAVTQTYYLHRRVSLPLTCLIFVLLAAPLSLRFARPQTNAFVGLVLTIAVVFVANGVINWAEVVALSGSGAWLRPGVAAWLHVWLFGGLALWLIAAADRGP